MQTIFLVVLVAVFAVVVVGLLTRRSADTGASNLARLAIGVAAGIVAAVSALAPRADIVPDVIEPVGIMAGVLTVSAILAIGSIVRLTRAH
ncbi:MAG: hypothetical protein ACJ771_10090 [Chloroflexota bacterium]